MRGQADVPSVQVSKGNTSVWVQGWVAIAAGAKDAMRCAARGRQVGASTRRALDGQQGDAAARNAARNAAPMQLQCSSNAAPMHEREPTLSGRFNLARREPLHALHCKLAAALLCWLPSALSLCLSVSLSLSCPRFGLSWASRCCNFGRLPHHHHPLPSSSFTPPSLHHRTPHPAQLRLPSTLSRIASSSLPRFSSSLLVSAVPTFV